MDQERDIVFNRIFDLLRLFPFFFVPRIFRRIAYTLVVQPLRKCFVGASSAKPFSEWIRLIAALCRPQARRTIYARKIHIKRRLVIAPWNLEVANVIAY